MRSLRAATAKAQLASARDRASKNRATSAARAASAFRATASSDARAAAAERPCRSFAKLQASVATPRGSSWDAFWATNAAAAEKRRGASASSDAQAQQLLATSWPFQSTDGSARRRHNALRAAGRLTFAVPSAKIMVAASRPLRASMTRAPASAQRSRAWRVSRNEAAS